MNWFRKSTSFLPYVYLTKILFIGELGRGFSDSIFILKQLTVTSISKKHSLVYCCITYQKSFNSRRISKKCKTLYATLFSSRIWMWWACLLPHFSLHHQDSFWGHQIFRQIQTTKLSKVVILKFLFLMLIIKMNGINAPLKISAKEVDIRYKNTVESSRDQNLNEIEDVWMNGKN